MPVLANYVLQQHSGNEQSIMWIRNPWWDGFWVLNGLLFGAALTCAARWVSPIFLVFYLVLALDTAHNLSPIALAWSNRGFRAVMHNSRLRFMYVPITILACFTVAGYFCSFYLPPAHVNLDRFSVSMQPSDIQSVNVVMMTMLVVYGVWNAWHFGMQVFGVMSLYRVRAKVVRSRLCDQVFGCGVVWAGMAIPFLGGAFHWTHDHLGVPAAPHPFLDYIDYAYIVAAIVLALWLLWRERDCLPRLLFSVSYAASLGLVWIGGLWIFAIVALNHWMTAVGLSAHAWSAADLRRAVLFAALLILSGVLLWCVLFWDPSKGFPSRAASHFAMGAVGFRLGLGLVHFLYDRWVWKLSDPQVRATIGADLFRAPQSVGVTAPLAARAPSPIPLAEAASD